MTNLKAWKTLSKKIVLKMNKYLTVESHEVELPDGQIIPDWAWVVTPDAVIVLAVTKEQKYICFRQTKYAILGPTLAPVGGMIEPHENPLKAAKRELLEETGYESNQWINLGSYVLEPNRGVGKVNLFFALDAQKITSPDAMNKDLEDQEFLLLSREELQSALSRREFKAIEWAAIVALALNYFPKPDHP